VDRDLKTRLVIGCFALVMVLSALSARLLHIEAIRSESLSAQARGHYEYKEILPARRGRIFDRSGELLARSQTVFTLVADLHHLSDPMLACIGLGEREGVSPQTIKARHLPEEIGGLYREYVAESLAEALEEPRHEIARLLKGKKLGEVVLAKNIEDDFARTLGKMLDEKEIGGVYLRRGERRYYPSPMTLTQVIGYVDEEGIGVAGIEKVFDAEMQGKPGHRYSERDRSRREIHAFRGLQVDPVAGRDVHLTIDMAVQTVVERELDAVIDRFRPAKATIIILDPSTSEVIAMASRPHFDLSTRMGIRGQEPVRRNPAIADLYQPGSTFKIVGYGGAFDRGLADPATEVDCHMGQYSLDGFVLKDHHPYGRLTARVAFAKSSNIGAYLLARPLNKDGFFHYVKEFGFGAKTGIELNGENAGRLIVPERWSATSFSSQVMGYEIAVTPMQMAMACAVVANGGLFRTPSIVRGVKREDPGAELAKEAMPAPRRVLGEKAAKQVMHCMLETMSEHGTGIKGNLPGYTVAGKTGTARKHVENVGYVDGCYVASFVGFLPAENPRFLGLVVIDEPKATGPMVYGGAVAAPVFKAIASEAVKILGIEPDRPGEPNPAPQVPLAEAGSAAGEAR
jgi:cell division protein FtsI/penicillin-binding protein 2